MLKSKLKLVPLAEHDPNKTLAVAILEAGRRTEESNKALITAVKGIIMAPPQVQVVQHEGKQVPLAAIARPTRWTFSMVRDTNGLLTQVTAEAE